jgi:hypothetical protein
MLHHGVVLSALLAEVGQHRAILSGGANWTNYLLGVAGLVGVPLLSASLGIAGLSLVRLERSGYGLAGPGLTPALAERQRHRRIPDQLPLTVIAVHLLAATTLGVLWTVTSTRILASGPTLGLGFLPTLAFWVLVYAVGGTVLWTLRHGSVDRVALRKVFVTVLLHVGALAVATRILFVRIDNPPIQASVYWVFILSGPAGLVVGYWLVSVPE